MLFLILLVLLLFYLFIRVSFEFGCDNDRLKHIGAECLFFPITLVFWLLYVIIFVCKYFVSFVKFYAKILVDAIKK
jgi:hypothetical protein